MAEPGQVILFGDEELNRRIEADLEFQRHIDSLWGTRFMIPHIFTGTYYEIETTHDLEVVSGWEVGPREQYEDSRWKRAFKLNRILKHRLRNSATPLPESQYGCIGRLVPCDAEHEHYRRCVTPFLVGQNRWDVANLLWQRYGYVTR